MWQEAAQELLPRTVAIVSSVEREVDGQPVKIWPQPQGSGFLVSTDPVRVVTNAHVVTDRQGNLLDDLQVGPFGGGPEYREIDGARWNGEIDLAVLSIQVATGAPPARIWAGEPLAMGTPIASLGLPAARPHDLDDPADAGWWQLTRRLSTGYVCQNEYPLIDQDGERFPEPVYEMNALIYGGNSGGPCFDQNGRVVGVVVTSLETATETIAFSHAIRSDHLIEALDTLGVSYESTES